MDINKALCLMSDFDYASAETTDFTSIPIIDMPDLDADTGLNSLNLSSLHRPLCAATEVGFFYLRNHGVPENLREQAMAASADFCVARRYQTKDSCEQRSTWLDGQRRGGSARGGNI